MPVTFDAARKKTSITGRSGMGRKLCCQDHPYRAASSGFGRSLMTSAQDSRHGKHVGMCCRVISTRGFCPSASIASTKPKAKRASFVSQLWHLPLQSYRHDPRSAPHACATTRRACARKKRFICRPQEKRFGIARCIIGKHILGRRSSSCF